MLNKRLSFAGVRLLLQARFFVEVCSYMVTILPPQVLSSALDLVLEHLQLKSL